MGHRYRRLGRHAGAVGAARPGVPRPGAEAEIRGGLFQDFAPSVFHLQHVIVPMPAQMVLAAEIEMIRPGYVPGGEGVTRLAVPAAVRPLRPLAPRRGEIPARVWGISLASHLDDRQVAARMVAAAREVLDAVGVSAEIEERSDSTAVQAGAAFALFVDFIGGTRLGRTAPSRKSRSNFLRVSPPSENLPLRGSLHAARGKPT